MTFTTAGLIVALILVAYAIYRVGEAIKYFTDNGVVLYHQTRGKVELEYEPTRDDKGWKVTTHPQY